MWVLFIKCLRNPSNKKASIGKALIKEKKSDLLVNMFDDETVGSVLYHDIMIILLEESKKLELSGI